MRQTQGTEEMLLRSPCRVGGALHLHQRPLDAQQFGDDPTLRVALALLDGLLDHQQEALSRKPAKGAERDPALGRRRSRLINLTMINA